MMNFFKNGHGFKLWIADHARKQAGQESGAISPATVAVVPPEAPIVAQNEAVAGKEAKANEPTTSGGALATEGQLEAVGQVSVKENEAPKVPTIPIAVEFQNVTKIYDKGTLAIENVSFKVEDLPEKGEFVTILGQSGCGKSTILRMIAGLAPQHAPTSGKALVFGKEIAGPGRERGMVFQDYTSFEHRTVLDNVAFGLECEGMNTKERRERASEALERVGLSMEDGKKYPQQLSGGMRQRVAIARTLILKPKVILMDEPFGALDPGIRYKMQDLLVSLWRETRPTIFFVTHSIEEAVYLGDRTFLMAPKPGRLIDILKVPEPDRPAKLMQRESGFMDVVYAIRDRLEESDKLAKPENGPGGK